MKRKLLYLSFVIAIILMLILVLARKERTVTRDIAEQTRQQEIPALESQGLAPLPLAGITIVKPAVKRVNPIIEQKREELRKQRELERLSAAASQQVAAPTGEPATGAATSGTTRIGKRPTEKQIREMNSRGIVMY